MDWKLKMDPQRADRMAVIERVRKEAEDYQKAQDAARKRRETYSKGKRQ